MKFEIKNRFTGAVQITAEIDCDENASKSVKLGLAVRWAIKSHANLSHANLSHANLSHANLSHAGLSHADLYHADLSHADLYRADLSHANLSHANLSHADLSRADLSHANLSHADLSHANLSGASGVNNYVKCIQIETYAIAYTSDILQIGCEKHAIENWRDFDEARISQIDGKTALKFWRKYKDWISATIELCPATPTKGEPKK